jgi:CheY-like chemotaxis protein
MSLVAICADEVNVVCEDNPVSRRVMEAMISKIGCRVVSHADGAEAVSAAMGDIKFDIIFTDLKLPKSTRYRVPANNSPRG